MTTVHKRLGGDEPFDPEKVYESVEQACQRVHDQDHGERHDCAAVAETVADRVAAWINDQETVASTDIRQQVIDALHDIDEAVAYGYKRATYMDMK